MLKNKMILIFIIFTCITGVGIFYVIENSTHGEEFINIENDIQNNNEKNEEIKKEESQMNKIVVHIDGCVNNPGIVNLEENSRLIDAIESAGGLTQDADIAKINLASYLEDGMKVYIPNKNDQENGTDNIQNSYIGKDVINTNISQTNIIYENNIKKKSAENKSINKNKKININNANLEDLKLLPGVGEGTASKIIEYRNKNGKFKNIDEIKEVNGIGKNKYEKIKDYICVK